MRNTHTEKRRDDVRRCTRSRVEVLGQPYCRSSREKVVWRLDLSKR